MLKLGLLWLLIYFIGFYYTSVTTKFSSTSAFIKFLFNPFWGQFRCQVQWYCNVSEKVTASWLKWAHTSKGTEWVPPVHCAVSPNANARVYIFRRKCCQPQHKANITVILIPSVGKKNNWRSFFWVCTLAYLRAYMYVYRCEYASAISLYIYNISYY